MPVRRLLGSLEHLALTLVGRLSDRSELVYRIDAALSARRRLRNVTRLDAAERADELDAASERAFVVLAER